MSRIGNSPIQLPEGVSVQVEGAQVSTKGPKGQLFSPLPEGIELKVENSVLQLVRKVDSSQFRSLHGTVRALLSNNIQGVSKGWEIGLDLIGVGYRAQLKGKDLVLSLGYSHEIKYTLLDSVSAQITDQTKITLSSIDKQALGQVAAEVRALRPPEPYKGKGVRYRDEIVRRKAGKAAKK